MAKNVFYALGLYTQL